MKTEARITAWMVLGLFVFSLAGCVSVANKDDLAETPQLLEPSNALKFSDLPVPSGFALLAENSYSFESAGVRVGVLKYQGRANPDQVVSFYREQMPMYNWDLLNVVEFGDRLMNFERSSESCIINIVSKGSTTVISVSLGPKSKKVLKGS